MTLTPSSKVRLGLDTADAQKDAASFGRSLLGSITPVVDVVDLGTKAFGFLADGIKAAVTAAIEAEKAQVGMANALRLTGQDVGGTLERLNGFNAALQQTTGVGDETALSIQRLLTTHKLHGDQLELATQATIGLARASDKDLLSAARDVAKMVGGITTKEIKSMGLSAETTKGKLEELARFTELAAAETRTFGGQLNLLSENWGDVLEETGQFITDSPSLVRSFETVNKVLAEGAAGLHDVRIETAGARDAFFGLVSALGELAAIGTGLKDKGAMSAQLKALLGGDADFLSGSQKLGATPDAIKALLAGGGGDSAPTGDFADLKARLAAGLEGQGAAIGIKDRIKGKPKAGKGGPRDTTTSQDVQGLFFDEGAAARAQSALNEIEAEEARKANLLELERGFQEERLKIQAYGDKLRTESEKAAAEERFQEEVASIERRKQAQADAAVLAASFAGQALSSVIGAALSGQEVQFNKIAGGFIQTLGGMISQFGEAAIAAGILGTAVPFLGALTGGPAAIAAGAAAVIAGATISGIGAAIASGGSGGKGRGSGRSAGAGAARAPSAGSARPGSGTIGESGGFVGFGLGQTAGNTTIVNVSIGVAGDPRGTARTIVGLLADYNTLRPGGGS